MLVLLEQLPDFVFLECQVLKAEAHHFRPGCQQSNHRQGQQHARSENQMTVFVYILNETGNEIANLSAVMDQVIIIEDQNKVF